MPSEIKYFKDFFFVKQKINIPTFNIKNLLDLCKSFFGVWNGGSKPSMGQVVGLGGRNCGFLSPSGRSGAQTGSGIGQLHKAELAETEAPSQGGQLVLHPYNCSTGFLERANE